MTYNIIYLSRLAAETAKKVVSLFLDADVSLLPDNSFPSQIQLLKVCMFYIKQGEREFSLCAFTSCLLYIHPTHIMTYWNMLLFIMLCDKLDGSVL